MGCWCQARIRQDGSCWKVRIRGGISKWPTEWQGTHAVGRRQGIHRIVEERLAAWQGLVFGQGKGLNIGCLATGSIQGAPGFKLS